MTSSVPFGALSDPIKLFDGLGHTYPPETFFAYLSACVTVQLGLQPLDIQPYLTWHSRRMSLRYCSFPDWYDRLPQVYKTIDLLSSKYSKKTILFTKICK